MKVTVRPYLFLSDLLGFKETVIDLPDGSTAMDLLRRVRRDYHLNDKINLGGGKLVLFDGDEPAGILVLVDGRNIKQLGGTAAALYDGATVTLFPPSAGG